MKHGTRSRFAINERAWYHSPMAMTDFIHPDDVIVEAIDACIAEQGAIEL